MNNEDNNGKIKISNIIFWLLAGIITILGMYLRLQYINRNLEYDEIWTITNYTNHSFWYIFSNLATPNNHPLSTLLTKFMLHFYGKSTFDLRLPSFISGSFTIITVALICYKLTKNRCLSIISIIIMSFNGALIYYSQTERGYSLQTFFITVVILLIVLTETSEFSKQKLIYKIVLFIFILLAIGTIPTSILYIFPIFILHLAYLIIKNRRIGKIIKDEKSTLAVYILSGVASLIWISINYSQLKSGQINGSSINSFYQLISFSKETLISLIPVSFLILAIVGIFLKRHRKIVLAGIIIVILPLISALLFKAGPSRVYTPTIPIICITAISSLSSIIFIFKKSMQNVILIAVGVVVFISLFMNIPKEHNIWFPPDWSSIYSFLNNNLPQNFYIVLPAYAGYPAFFNNDSLIIINNIDRVPKNNGFILIASENNDQSSIDGISPNGDTVTLSLPKTSSTYLSQFNVYLYLYQLADIKASKSCPSPVFLSVFPDKNLHRLLNIPSTIGQSVTLNRWFSNMNNPHCLMFTNSSLSANSIKRAENETNRSLQFFKIEPVSKKDVLKHIEF